MIIIKNKYYGTKEIIEKKMIVNSVGKPSYDYILKVLRTNAICPTNKDGIRRNYKNVSLSSGKALHRIKGEEIIEFRKRMGYE